MRSDERIAISENVSKHILNTTHEAAIMSERLAPLIVAAALVFLWGFTLNLI